MFSNDPHYLRQIARDRHERLRREADASRLWRSHGRRGRTRALIRHQSPPH